MYASYNLLWYCPLPCFTYTILFKRKKIYELLIMFYCLIASYNQKITFNYCNCLGTIYWFVCITNGHLTNLLDHFFFFLPEEVIVGFSCIDLRGVNEILIFASYSRLARKKFELDLIIVKPNSSSLSHWESRVRVS